MFVAQLVWFGLAAFIMFVDRHMVEAQSDPSNPDITDRSPVGYLLFTLIFGGLVIPFYLWNSRKTSGAVIAGIGLMFGCALIASLVMKSAA